MVFFVAKSEKNSAIPYRKKCYFRLKKVPFLIKKVPFLMRFSAQLEGEKCQEVIERDYRERL